MLLVGSAPMNDAEEMFRTCMAHVGDYVRRLPDGEVGERDTWIRWQHPRLRACPQIRQGEEPNVYVPWPYLELEDGITAADQIEMPDMGYADAAIESYAVFKCLRDEGVIPKKVRFQVGLPTPLSVVSFYVRPRDRDLTEQAYEREIIRLLNVMAASIPAEDLAIQWETVAEFAVLEGIQANHLGDDPLGSINERLVRLVDAVPEGIEVGIHLCYGDSGHKHFCEPADTGYLVQVANGVLERVGRPVAWLHLPVPKERDDDAYFEPLSDLALPDGTELYLGLVHNTGGAEGTRRRIEAARKFVAEFGVATECGLGRRPRDTIDGLLDQHTAVADPVAAAE